MFSTLGSSSVGIGSIVKPSSSTSALTPSTAVNASAPGAGAPASSSFEFPREYHFPPFFTKQTNLTTRHSQLEKWSSLVLAYCRHHRLFKLSLSALSSSAYASAANPAPATAAASSSPGPSGGAEDLFYNRRINRHLSVADAREVLEFMRRDGRAEYVGGGSAKDGGDVFWIHWRTPEEWAEMVDSWVDETAQKGTVLTLYELTDGEATRGTEFHGLDTDLLQKALQVLVKRGKAQIFGQEDQQGVKFF
ncbi:ESCRT-II complex, vps25 subunit [Durotheca rogersii]|uniref:ESCRT-II complex, vps25 subunit n=1 Tax=Durotheca rogersii TaxID=419775 RepID=UPI002220C65F|nr:ESCRT-II complex, vps25 subunit [Durotheca rogersii]KAI5866191.1 ESCRT-II complex, vps25 subunit [Durotheca rogersii]